MMFPLAFDMKDEVRWVDEMSYIFLTTTADVPRDSCSLNYINFHSCDPGYTLGYFFKKPF